MTEPSQTNAIYTHTLERSVHVSSDRVG